MLINSKNSFFMLSVSLVVASSIHSSEQRTKCNQQDALAQEQNTVAPDIRKAFQEAYTPDYEIAKITDNNSAVRMAAFLKKPAVLRFLAEKGILPGTSTLITACKHKGILNEERYVETIRTVLALGEYTQDDIKGALNFLYSDLHYFQLSVRRPHLQINPVLSTAENGFSCCTAGITFLENLLNQAKK